MDEQTIARAGEQLRRSRALAKVLDWRLALMEMRRERILTARDRRTLASLDGRDDLRLNVGSSHAYVDGWINVDVGRDAEGRVFRMDAAETWPFATASAEAVNSEHFVEHLTLDQVSAYFREAHRVLRPGGVIRTSTPDLEGICAAYVRDDDAALAVHRSHGYEARNLADLVNNYFYSHGHRHIFDFATLEEMLGDVGFTQVERVAFGESRHDVLRGIDTHEVGALAELVVAVDAVKPG
jgi:predicted SAM-dependent methyltransferase